MKLLFLLPSVPDPPTAGAQLRNLGLLRLASAEHQVDAIGFGDADAGSRLAALVRHSVVVPMPPARGRRERAAALARSPLPDMAERLWSPAFASAVDRLLASEHYDAVQAEGIEMARYLPPSVRTVYDAHNAEFLLQRRAADGTGLAALYSQLQWRRLARFEGNVVRTAATTLAVSQHDANQLEALASNGACVEVVPNGVDADRFALREPRLDDPPNVLFMGTLAFRPNAEAIARFARDVLPRLFRLRPEARLFVVGASPPCWLVRMGQQDDRIAVVGPVADERRYLARCSALVLPHTVGGGSRLKALVALASGLPIVSTTLGMEGLEAEPDTHFLLASSDRDMAEAVDRVLGDVALRRRLARAGRELIDARYSWPRIAPRLRAAYASLR
ncbi:MAG: glycosyltransferase [Chloroflexi bacterium]|nr:glycosyltransferase [Chloroflexota bacterium]